MAFGLPLQSSMKAIKKTFGDEPTILAILAIALAVVALWAMGCGGGGGSYSTPTAPTTSAPAASSASAANVTVNIIGSTGNTAFTPNPASATAGQTVAFKNNDGTMHHLVADAGGWDSGDLQPGATSKTLPVASSSAVNFHCTIHPTMVGTINGATAPPVPTQNSSGGYDYGY
jgi:plastocyanin